MHWRKDYNMAKALRKCRKCGLEANVLEDLQMFRTNNKLKYNKDNMCNDCQSTHSRAGHLIRTYGITVDDYNMMYKDQQGKCKICDTDELRKDNKHMCVDHCHETGVVRGLLCHDCNTGLGKFKDREDLLLKSILYLKGQLR